MDENSEQWFRTMLGLAEKQPLPPRLVEVWNLCAEMQARLGAPTVFNTQVMCLMALLAGESLPAVPVGHDGEPHVLKVGAPVKVEIDGSRRACTVAAPPVGDSVKVKLASGKLQKVPLEKVHLVPEENGLRGAEG